jgi:hypothetical protein
MREVMESRDIVNLGNYSFSLIQTSWLIWPIKGVIGRFYSCRNVLGFYRCTSALAVCTYSTAGLPHPDTSFMKRFDRALYKTVQYHPSLCYGIVDKTPDREAHFLRLKVVYKEDVAEFCGQTQEEARQNDDDSSTIKLLEKSHARILSEGHCKPAWRVVVFKHGGQWGSESQQLGQSVQKLSIAFLASHAIADGLSHTNFHKTFFHFFNSSQPEELVWPYQVPRDLRCPILLEEVVDLQARDENDNTHINYDSTNIWSGANMFLPSIEEYESGLRLVNLPLAQLGKVLQFCKSYQITLTGLIHGLLVTYLSRAIAPGHMFRAVIPYSMRHITKVADDEICNHASALVVDSPDELATAIRNTPTNSSQELKLIIGIATDYRRHMAAELARSPKNNVWAGMFGIDDWYGPSLSQLGKKRALTYELSNFGNVEVIESDKLQDSPLSLEKVLVSQCGSVTGPVFCQGGPMTITLTWQKGSVEEDIINNFAEYLTERLLADFDSVSQKE